MSQVLVITTGGTIDKVYFDALSDFQVGDSVVDELLKQAHVTAAFRVDALMRKDSLEMTDADRALIVDTVKAASETRVVITHGTDTMTETATALAGVSGKVIVLTGALSPARFAVTDATFNVGMAFAAVQVLSAGVYVAMNGQIFDGLKVRKERQPPADVSAGDASAGDRFVAC